MKIKIENFILEQEANSPTKFNIIKLGIVETGKNAGKEKKTTIAYAMSIPHAIERMAAENLLTIEDTTSLKEFVSMFVREQERLFNLFTHGK